MSANNRGHEFKDPELIIEFDTDHLKKEWEGRPALRIADIVSGASLYMLAGWRNTSHSMAARYKKRAEEGKGEDSAGTRGIGHPEL
jgi:hypothetical protein